MAKAKFDRTKPHVNVGTLVGIVILPLMLCLSLFANDKIFDFDGTHHGRGLSLEKFNEAVNSHLPAPHKVALDGILKTKFFRITESGQEIEVLPGEFFGGKGYYKFKPNEEFFSETTCSYPYAGYWDICEYYKFNPGYGGHNHNGSVPPYTWNNQPVPNPKCRYNVPVNQPVRTYFKTPEFATRDDHKRQAWGTCTGAIYDIVDIKIDGLTLLPPAWADSLHGGVTYYNLINNPPYSAYHPIYHFGKSQTIALLKQIAWQYHGEFPRSEVLNINDMSLKWGGLFDIDANWQSGPNGHNRHRYGRQADVRLWSIPVGNRKRFEEISCNLGVRAETHGKNCELLSALEQDVWRNTDFKLAPWSELSSDELDAKTPHYHLVFPKFDTEVDDPPDQLPQNCPPPNRGILK